MIEAKYFRDYRHNYLILQGQGGNAGENYQRKMLASNKIERLLKCSVRNVNGEVYFYYEISSKVTLENLYQTKKMNAEQVRDLFHQILLICQNLGQYFMEESGLLMRPDYIYYDIESKKYFGLYYPEERAQEENPYEELLEFLLSHAALEDQKLADAVYRIYEMAEGRCFGLADALALLEEEETTAYDAEQPQDISNYFVENREDSIETDGLAENENEAKRGASKNRIYYTVFALLSLCGMGAALWTYQTYILSEQELMILTCGAAAIGLCFLFSCAQIVLSVRREKRKASEEAALRQDIADEFRDEKPIVLQNVLEKGNLPVGGSRENFRTDSPCKRYGIDEMNGTNGVNGVNGIYGMHGEHRAYEEYGTYGTHEGREAYGATVFVDIGKREAECKLYALDKKNKKHIELDQFPFTIGKMPGCVDCVLTDESISRLHARIEKRDGRMYLTDMNSTNGTFKNGLRMQPSETLEIEPGDEIRFGKLNYCYR